MSGAKSKTTTGVGSNELLGRAVARPCNSGEPTGATAQVRPSVDALLNKYLIAPSEQFPYWQYNGPWPEPQSASARPNAAGQTPAVGEKRQ